MPATGAAKTARTKITNVEILLRKSGPGYVVTYEGKDVGTFMPLNAGIFPKCAAAVGNALRAWHNNR